MDGVMGEDMDALRQALPAERLFTDPDRLPSNRYHPARSCSAGAPVAARPATRTALFVQADDPAGGSPPAGARRSIPVALGQPDTRMIDDVRILDPGKMVAS